MTSFVSPQPKPSGKPANERIQAFFYRMGDAMDGAVHRAGLRIKAWLRTGQLDAGERFELSLGPNSRIKPVFSSVSEQIERARGLAGSAAARESLCRGELTLPDAQTLAIGKLDNLEDLQQVSERAPIAYPATITLQVRRSELRAAQRQELAQSVGRSADQTDAERASVL